MSAWPRELVRRIFTYPIRYYQRYISLRIAPRCRYAPTCSAYALHAIEIHGVVKGIILGTWRLLRCNPWSHGGVDNVPEVGRWKPEPWVPPDDWAGNATDIVRPAPMGMSDEYASFTTPQNFPASAGRPKDASSVRTS